MFDAKHTERMNDLFQTLKNADMKTAFQLFDCKGNKTAISYEQFFLDVCRCISLLNDRISPLRSAHIAIIARNSYHYIVCMYAILGAGAVYIPLNIEKSVWEIRQELQKGEVTFIIHDGEFVAREPEFAVEYSDCLIGVDDYCGISSEQSWIERNPEELAMIMFTSGTTGSSKGVAVSYRALNANADAFHEFYLRIKQRRFSEEMNCFFCLPLYHIYAICVLTACISSGFTVSLCTDMRYFMRDLVASDSNFTAVVPGILITLSRFINMGHLEKLGSIKDIVSAGAICTPEVMSIFLDNDVNIYNHYGLTENAVAALNESDEYFQKTHSVGRPFGNTEIRIMDGEILLKGDSMLDGYYNDPEITAESIQDGWFHTGDLGYMDEDGYLYITGRKKNVIILSSGENVSPEELEGLFLRNDAIKEVVVKEKEEKICAEIFCEESEQEGIREHVQEINREVAMYKRVTLIEFRTEPFPKTGSGKIKRY